MAQLSAFGNELRQKIVPWLPEKASLSNKAVARLERAFVHSTASSVNMAVPAKFGDIHMKSCLATVFESRYGDERTAGEVTLIMNATVENQVLDNIFTGVLSFDDTSIITGADYRHTEQRRSTHRRGTVVEALIAGVKGELGYDVCVQFVERIWDAYFGSQGKSFKTFMTPNPIGELGELLAKNMAPACISSIASHF